MARKYPMKMFWLGVVTNFLFRYLFLLAPGVILLIPGIWLKPCLWIGLGILGLDLIVSVAEQLRLRKTALMPSGNPEFNELMDALCGPGGLEEFGSVVDAKIKSAPSDETSGEPD